MLPARAFVSRKTRMYRSRAIQVIAGTGSSLMTTAATSAVAALPLTNGGALPRIVRVVADGYGFIRFGNGVPVSTTVTVTSAGSAYSSVASVAFSGGGTNATQATGFAVMKVATVASVATPGTAYSINDVLTVVGGTKAAAATLTVSHLQVVSATVAAGGSGGTNGTQTVTGTTGTGTKFQASVTIAGGAITAVLSITVAGDYTVGPTLLTAEPVTGVSLSGATLNIVMGVLTATVTVAGTYTALPPATAAVTGGTGTGATFTFTFSVASVTVTDVGKNYITAPTITLSGNATATSALNGTPIAAVGTDIMITPTPELFDVAGMTYYAGIWDVSAFRVSVVAVEF